LFFNSYSSNRLLVSRCSLLISVCSTFVQAVQVKHRCVDRAQWEWKNCSFLSGICYKSQLLSSLLLILILELV